MEKPTTGQAAAKVHNNKLLTAVERIGNKVPHTLALFLGLIVFVLLVTWVYALAKVTVTHPATGDAISVVNLFSKYGAELFFTTFITNFQKFPILGVTVVVGIAMGLCEVSGMFSSVIKMSLKKVRSSFLVFFISLFGIFMCSFDGTVSMIVVPTLAAAIYYSMGKNPLIGIFCGYAAACAGASLEFVPGFWQVALTPLTNSAAQLLDPNFSMPIMSDYFPVVFSSVIMIFVNTFVTIKFIEPRFSNYEITIQAGEEEAEDLELTPVQRKAAKGALISLGIYLLVIFLLCLPQGSFFRAATGSLVIDAPLMYSLENLLVWFFFIPGLVYAKMSGQMKGISDLANLLTKGTIPLIPVIILFVLIGQFIAIFNVTNLGAVVSIQLGNWINTLAIPPFIIVIIIFLFVVCLDMFVISGSTKYIIFAPILIPLLMQLNVHPAFSQFVLRMSDAAVNNLSPFNPFFPVLLVLAQRYSKRVGVGTVFSAMLPYSVSFVIVLLGVIILWMALGLPVGLAGATIWLN